MRITFAIAAFLGLVAVASADLITLDLTKEGSNDVAIISPADNLLVSLKEMQGTGYSWHVVETSANDVHELVHNVKSEFIKPSSNSNDVSFGATGVRQLTFDTLDHHSMGHQNIDLVYAKVWEYVKVLNQDGSLNKEKVKELGFNMTFKTVNVQVVETMIPTQ